MNNISRETFSEIMQEVAKGRNPRASFDFDVYYNFVKYVPEGRAKLLRERMILCEKNFFAYPGFLQEIAFALSPPEQVSIPERCFQMKNKQGEMKHYNLDDYCWKCHKPLNDQKDFCEKCLEADKTDAIRIVNQVREVDPNNKYLKIYDKYLKPKDEDDEPF